MTDNEPVRRALPGPRTPRLGDLTRDPQLDAARRTPAELRAAQLTLADVASHHTELDVPPEAALAEVLGCLGLLRWID